MKTMGSKSVRSPRDIILANIEYHNMRDTKHITKSKNEFLEAQASLESFEEKVGSGQKRADSCKNAFSQQMRIHTEHAERVGSFKKELDSKRDFDCLNSLLLKNNKTTDYFKKLSKN